MKKVLLSLFVIILTTGMLSAQVDRHRNQRGNGHRSTGNGNGYGHAKLNRPSADKTVHAPLDGGLLLALGGAGVAYYAARKRKKEQS